jgi:hypothetical protein
LPKKEIQVKTILRFYLQSEWLSLTTETTTNASENVEQKEPSSTVDRNVN